MELHDFLRRAQRLLSLRQQQKLTQRGIAMLINISPRTYVEYVRGNNRPKGMRALLDLLCLLDREDLDLLLTAWQTEKKENRTDDPSNSEKLNNTIRKPKIKRTT